MSKYVFKPYDPIFPILFENEKKRLLSYLTGNYRIEHIGSTAIPNLGGKGIIDIAIAIRKEQMQNFCQNLQKAGYTYEPEDGTNERMFFWQDLLDTLESNRRYHIHLTFPESDEWKRVLLFRDYLKKHPSEAKKYADIKKKAVNEINVNKEKYMAAKSPLMEELLKKASTEKF
ncbi:MAG: GrpB family protein [Patescibacteria group bacterium]|nr:GrpB family protein [Patescibacteria group bacterium]